MGMAAAPSRAVVLTEVEMEMEMEVKVEVGVGVALQGTVVGWACRAGPGTGSGEGWMTRKAFPGSASRPCFC